MPAESPAGAVRIEVGSWAQLADACTPVRFTVFVDEQHVPADQELDADDAVSLHAVARDAAGAVIGTGRLLPDGHIGRMAVLAAGRGRGVGSALLEALMREAAAQGHRVAVLNAQQHAVPFYERHGYVVCSAPFDDCGIAHVEMRAALLPGRKPGQPPEPSGRD
jgi:predicted GNAT family N-acyltransferase